MSFEKSDLRDLIAAERESLRVNGFELRGVHTTKSNFHLVIRTDDGETRGTLDGDRFKTVEEMYTTACQRAGVEPTEGLGDLFG